MKFIALKTPGYDAIELPKGVPDKGLFVSGISAIQVFINLLFLTGTVLALAFIIYSGIQWVTSGGDKQKLQAARSRLTFTIIGLIVIALSFVIVQIVISLLGYKPEFFFKFFLSEGE